MAKNNINTDEHLVQQHFVGNHALNSAVKNSLREFLKISTRHFGNTKKAAPYLPAEDFSYKLELCMDEFKNEIIKPLCEKHSKTIWLWALRRLPKSVFSGILPTTLGYDSLLASTLTSIYAKPPKTMDWHTSKENNISPKNLPDLIRDLTQYTQHIRILSSCHSAKRRAARGFESRISTQKPGSLSNPFDHPENESLSEALFEFDLTLGDRENPFSRLGISPLNSSQETRLSFPLWTFISDEMTYDFLIADDTRVILHAVAGGVYNDHGWLIDVDQKLVSINPQSGIFTEESAAIIVCLKAFPFIVRKHPHGSALIDAKSKGYVQCPRQCLEKSLRLSIRSLPYYLRQRLNGLGLNSEKIIEKMLAITGLDFPLKPGSLLIDTEMINPSGQKNYILDFLACTAMLDAILAYPTETGAVANARGAFFENQVAEILENSALGKLKKGTPKAKTVIKHNKRYITDIDAIGETEDFVLIVSAKSQMFTDEQEAGDYKKCQSQLQNTQKYLQKQQEIIDDLTLNPKGDNYDFTGKEIIWTLCTPTPVFVDDAKFYSQNCHGLPKLVCIDQLRAWLTQRESPNGH